MIKKIFTILLCLNIMGCGGTSYRTGLKFARSVDSGTDSGNPNNTGDTLRLKNNKYTSFYRPMGECGVGVTFFIFFLIPIPVWFHINTCNNKLIINGGSDEIVNLQLKYDGKIYDAIDKKTLYIEQEMFKSNGNNTTYTFKIDSFWKFRFAKDKALIVTTKDGLVQELPVKWGVMNYNNWSFI